MLKVCARKPVLTLVRDVVNRCVLVYADVLLCLLCIALERSSTCPEHSFHQYAITVRSKVEE